MPDVTVEEAVEQVRAEIEESLLLLSLPVSEQVALWNEQPLDRRIQRARWFLLGTGRWPGDDNVDDARFDYVVDGSWITFHVNLRLRRAIEQVYFTVAVE